MRTTITLAVATIIATLAVALLIHIGPAAAGERCPLGICDGQRAKTFDARKLRTGDIYNPGHGRRLQIRNKNLRILGYIEVPSGKVTDRQRRKVGSVEGLR